LCEAGERIPSRPEADLPRAASTDAVDSIRIVAKAAIMARSKRSRRKSGEGRSVDSLGLRWPGAGRILAVAAVGILMGLEVARVATANGSAEGDPEFAADLAPFSPPALVSSAMAEVGRAAANGQRVDSATLEKLKNAAAGAPLQLEPFLVHAAIAERKGNLVTAESLLEIARSRDPRSTAALYLLADVRLREGKIVQGLRQLALLSRIMPATSVQLVPALADFARAPGAEQTLAAILRTNPELRRPLLNSLSTDSANADLALALAGPELRSPEPGSQAWKSRLLRGLVQRGETDHAYAMWRKFAGLPSGFSALLFNGDFRTLAAPPPFNWTYISGSAGIAESANGKLRVLFYGNTEQTLASQVLLLNPGAYWFQAQVSGNLVPGGLSWTLTCSRGGPPIMDASLSLSSPDVRFEVPADCPSQTLRLIGHLQDMPQDSDVQVGPVRLEKVAA
jgi:hypothetical protein